VISLTPHLGIERDPLLAALDVVAECIP